MEHGTIKKARCGVVFTVSFWLMNSLAVAAEKPNFVVILVDDAALMDFGAYGGEARTPHIDALAGRGVSFSNYRTSPMCAPSRAMLLTGLDSHRTGVGTLPELISDEQAGSDGYALHLLPGVRTAADWLRGGGYETFMSGKWHLGDEVAHLPHNHGFDRSFALAASGADNWEDKSYMPYYADAPWYEDGFPVGLPDDFYSSEFLVDKMLSYLESRDRGKPFFSFLAFQAVHIPVQAPREFTANYEEVYRLGWEEIRRQRLSRARSLGLLAQDAPAPLLPQSPRSWDALTDEERRHYQMSMMVNAGMLEAMDHHLGRLLAFLRQAGDLENTVFVITSDNGPESGDPFLESLFELWMGANGYHFDPESYGETGYMGAIGEEWASAAAGPGALFKMYASEGGTHVPLIISGPGIAPQGFNGARAFVTDITPTLLQMAGVQVDRGASLDGRSLLPILDGTLSEVYPDTVAVAMELSGNAFVLKGNYKLTRNTRPQGDGVWRLHDIAKDPGETEDLSAAMPDLREALLADYAAYADQYGVVNLPADFDIVAQVNRKSAHRLLERNALKLLVLLLCLVLLVTGLFRLARHGRAGRQEPGAS